MATNQGLLDLQAAEAALGTSVAAAVALLQTLATDLTNALAGDDDAAVEAAAQAIAAQISTLNSAVQGATPPPPPAA